jgi:hypothetical protein
MTRKAQRHDGGAGPMAASLAPRPESSTATAGGATAGDATAKQDVVLLGPPTADGAGVHVLRARDERIEAGELRPVQEGKPLVGELVSLRPRADAPRICDVTESWNPKGETAPGAHKGPAQVATSAYRNGWEQIFAKPGDAVAEPDRRALN